MIVCFIVGQYTIELKLWKVLRPLKIPFSVVDITFSKSHSIHGQLFVRFWRQTGYRLFRETCLLMARIFFLLRVNETEMKKSEARYFWFIFDPSCFTRFVRLGVCYTIQINIHYPKRERKKKRIHPMLSKCIICYWWYIVSKYQVSF